MTEVTARTRHEPPEVTDILSCCNQPAVDHYIALVEVGDREGAIAAILEDEPHQVTRPMAEVFVDHIAATSPNKAVLDWTKPPKDYEQRNKPGELVKWRAKLVGKRGANPRVEIRKTVLSQERDSRMPGGIRHWAAQVLLVVDASGVKMSANGTMKWDRVEWEQLAKAVREAQVALDAPPTLL